MRTCQPMKHTLIVLLLTVCALAQAADDKLYRAFGERAGLALLMADFVSRLKADSRIGHHFEDTKSEHLAKQLTDQLCVVAGGPCIYEGETMAEAHRELAIQRFEFFALVELLQDSMTGHGIPFATQNAMLARLAPMHREIVTR